MSSPAPAPGRRRAGVRNPVLIALFPLLLLLTAAAAARLNPWLNRLFHPERFFSYEPPPPILAIDQEAIERWKQQLLAADDPRWLILYHQTAVFDRTQGSQLKYELTATEQQQLARWVDDPDRTVAVTARLLRAGDFTNQPFPGEAEQPGDAELRADPEARLQAAAGTPVRQLALLDRMVELGLAGQAQQFLAQTAGPELRRLYCRRGPFSSKWVEGQGMMDQTDFYDVAVFDCFRQGLNPGFTLREFLEDTGVANPRVLLGIVTSRDEPPMPAQQVLGLIGSRDPMLALVGYSELQRREGGGGERDRFPVEMETGEGVGALARGEATGPELTAALARARKEWDRLARERPCLMREIVAQTYGEAGGWWWLTEGGAFPPTPVPAGIEEQLGRELAQLKLDERSADFSLPPAAALTPVWPRYRDAAREHPDRFEIVWAAVKLSLVVNQDYGSVRLLYWLERDPANRARIVEFVFKLPDTAETGRLIRAMMNSTGAGDPDQAEPVVEAAWDKSPSLERIEEIFTAATEQRMVVDSRMMGRFQRWLAKAENDPARKLRLLLNFSRIPEFGLSFDPVGMKTELLEATLARVPEAEQALILQEYFERSPHVPYRLWAAARLCRLGVPTGIELARARLHDPWAAAGAFRVLYAGLPAAEFPCEAFRRFGYARPGEAGALIAGGLFSRPPDRPTHDLFESMAADLAVYPCGPYPGLRAVVVSEMERLNAGNDDYWGVALPPTPAGGQVSEQAVHAQTAQDRTAYRSIDAAGDHALFWEIYQRAPQGLWSMRPDGIGPRIFMHFLNHPNAPADRETRLDELLTYYGSEVWQKTVAAEKLIGAGHADEIAGFPVATVPKLTAAPRVDGQFTGEEWKEALRLEPGHQEIDGEPLATAVYLGYTDEGLALAWEAADRKERIESQTYDQNGSMHKRESFSFILDVDRAYTRLMAFNADYWGQAALDNWETARSGGAPRRQVPIEWDGDRWRGEAFLTWAELRAARPERGTVWRFNFRRNQIEGSRTNYYQWVEVPRNPYQPEYFGFIVFK